MKTLSAPNKTKPSNFSRLVRAVEIITNRLLAAEKRIAELEAEKNTND